MPVSLSQLLLRSARAYPRRAALAVGDRVVADYATLAARVAAIAGGMRGRHGLRENDRVALVMKNCTQYVELLFACWHAGLAAVPVNAKLHPRELEFILEDSGAGVCFVTGDLASSVAPLAGRVATLAHVIDAQGPEYEALARAEPVAPAERDASDITWSLP
ncbi:MAG: AMP-binding protein [Betaproteobacteria bacterium]|nr:AMP-binding protein [Betaproteobacteria bacterium]